MDRFAFIWLHMNGRIARRCWLVFAVVIAVLEFLTEHALRSVFHWPPRATGPDAPFVAAFLGDEISLLSDLIFLWPALAIDVKRLHDIGVSGWATLSVYAPAAILYGLGFAGIGGAAAHPDPRAAALLYVFSLAALVYFILLAARKGMPEPNPYGPPLP